MPPLYLLALQCNIKTLSLQRLAVDVSSEETIDGVCKVFNREKDTSSGLKKETQKHASEISESRASDSPQYRNGQCLDMYHIFRRHVKPKKQHEIQKLGEVCTVIVKITTSK